MALTTTTSRLVGRPGTGGLAAMAAGALLGLAAVAGTAGAADAPIGVELNKTEDVDGKCYGSFVVYNNLPSTLDRFSMDLFVFDANQIISDHRLLELGPLRKSKTTIATFELAERPCADIHHIVLNAIPACHVESGQDVDCLSEVKLWSKSAIQFWP